MATSKDKTKKAISFFYQQAHQKWLARSHTRDYSVRFYDYLAEEMVKAGIGFVKGDVPTIHIMAGGLTTCCAREPYELPRIDRTTNHANLVTCKGRK